MTATRPRKHSDGQENVTAMVAGTNDENAYRTQLLAQIDRLGRLHRDLEELASDDSARWDAAKLTHLESAAQLGGVEERLNATTAALNRLTEGTFGLCVDCSDVIPPERLEARPEAHLCMPCCQRRSA